MKIENNVLIDISSDDIVETAQGRVLNISEGVKTINLNSSIHDPTPVAERLRLRETLKGIDIVCFPKSLTYITGLSCLKYMPALKEVRLHEAAKTIIYGGAFEQTTNIKELYVPKGCVLQSNALKGTEIKRVKIESRKSLPNRFSAAKQKGDYVTIEHDGKEYTIVTFTKTVTHFADLMCVEESVTNKVNDGVLYCGFIYSGSFAPKKNKVPCYVFIDSRKNCYEFHDLKSAVSMLND